MRDEQLGLTVEHLLSTAGETTYRSLSDHAGDGLLNRLRALRIGNRFVIRMWERAPASDWGAWADRLDPEGDLVEASQVDAVLERLIRSVPGADAEVEPGQPEMITRATKIRERSEVGNAARRAVAALTEQLLDPQAWTHSEDELELEQRLHDAARALGSLDSELEKEIEELLTESIIRGLTSATGAMEPAQPAIALRGSVRLAGPLADRSIARIVPAIPQFDPETEHEAASAEMFARARFALLVRERHIDLDSALTRIDRDKLIGVASGDGDLRFDAIGAWLGLGESVDLVMQVIIALPSKLPSSVISGLERWSATVSKNQRTALIKRFVSDTWLRDDSIRAVATHDVNETAVSDEFESAILDAPNDYERRLRVREAKAVGFKTQHAGHVLSNSVCGLLIKGRPKSDISVAVELVDAIPTAHVKRQLISRAIKGACNRHGYKLKGAEVSILGRAQVAVDKKVVKKRFRDKINPFK